MPHGWRHKYQPARMRHLPEPSGDAAEQAPKGLFGLDRNVACRLFHTSLDSPGTAAQLRSRANPLRWPAGRGSSGVLHLRVECESVSAQHPVGQVHLGQLLTEEKTSTDWWFGAAWNHFRKIIHDESSPLARAKKIFDEKAHELLPAAANSFLSYLEDVWNVHTAHGRARLHLALNLGGPSLFTPSTFFAESDSMTPEISSALYNPARTAAASETAPLCTPPWELSRVNFNRRINYSAVAF